MDWHQAIAHDQTAYREQHCGTGRDEGNAIEMKDDVYWIGRLPLADYYIEQRSDGGEELYLLANAWLRHPGKRW